MHDGHAFTHIVGTETANGRALAYRIGFFLDHGNLPCLVVESGCHVGETIYAGDNVCGIFSQSVQDDTQRFLLPCSRIWPDQWRLPLLQTIVSRTESETGGFFTKQHRGQVPVADTDFAVVGN